MKLLLTVNGKGTRFSNEGYHIPKFMLPYGNDTIISSIIKNISDGTKGKQLEVIVGLNKSYNKYKKYIEKQLLKLDIINTIFVLEDLPGQAFTASELIRKSNMKDEPFWIMNCDTVVENLWSLHDEDVVIEVFNSKAEDFSYVDRLDPVKIIREKIVISSYASSGNYFFKSSKRFVNYLNSLSFNREIFVSDVINVFIEKNNRVSARLVDNDQVTVLGTPKQYEDVIKN